MKARAIPLVLVGIAALILLGACRSLPPVFNIVNAPLAAGSSDYTLEDVESALIQAGATLDWEMRPVEQGHMVGTLRFGRYVAVVDITFNKKTYNIHYQKSTNLKYDGKGIHGGYNKRIKILNKAISIRFAAM